MWSQSAFEVAAPFGVCDVCDCQTVETLMHGGLYALAKRAHLVLWNCLNVKRVKWLLNAVNIQIPLQPDGASKGQRLSHTINDSLGINDKWNAEYLTLSLLNFKSYRFRLASIARQFLNELTIFFPFLFWPHMRMLGHMAWWASALHTRKSSTSRSQTFMGLQGPMKCSACVMVCLSSFKGRDPVSLWWKFMFAGVENICRYHVQYILKIYPHFDYNRVECACFVLHLNQWFSSSISVISFRAVCI